MTLDIEQLKHDLVFNDYEEREDGIIILLETGDIFLPFTSLQDYITD